MNTLECWAKEKPRDRRAKMSDIRTMWNAGYRMPEPWGKIDALLLDCRGAELKAFDGRVEDDDFVIDGQYTRTERPKAPHDLQNDHGV